MAGAAPDHVRHQTFVLASARAATVLDRSVVRARATGFVRHGLIYTRRLSLDGLLVVRSSGGVSRTTPGGEAAGLNKRPASDVCAHGGLAAAFFLFFSFLSIPPAETRSRYGRHRSTALLTPTATPQLRS